MIQARNVEKMQKKSPVRRTFRSTLFPKKTNRTRIYLWAMLLSIGLVYSDDLYQPIELLITGARNVIRRHKSDGNIIVVALDDATITKLGGVNFPRHYLAEGVDQLFKMGARRVYFDRIFNDTEDPEDDSVFAKVLQKHKNDTFLGSYAPIDKIDNKLTTLVPTPQLRNASSLTSLYTLVLGAGMSADFPYNERINNKSVPSMTASLAHVPSNVSGFYHPDYAIKASTIPTISFLEILSHSAPDKLVRGKDIIIGPTAVQYQDSHLQIDQGYISGVYFHVIGAETLKGRLPTDWGRWPALMIAALLAALNLWSNERRLRRISLAILTVALGLIPLALDRLHIAADVFPGLFLFSLVSIRGQILRNREAAFNLNEFSGLPNINALIKCHQYQQQTLIAMKINNLSEISSKLNARIGDHIVTEIKRRIDLLSYNEQIYQGDTTLYWFSNLPMNQYLADHLEGLRAITNKAIEVNERLIDINVTFGIDNDHEQLITARIGSTTLCAEEAAEENLIWKFYDTGRRNENASNLNLMSALDDALERQELFVHYQPKQDLITHKIVGAEALIRWQHPNHGTLMPDSFIPLAEKFHRIDRLTHFVLEEAIRCCATTRRTTLNFNVAVNISAQSLTHPDFVTNILMVLDRYDVPNHCLTLEITETAKFKSLPVSLQTVQRLYDLGVNISIDDYGTGFSTLDYLRLIPSHEVKVDKRFISHLDTNDQNNMLVSETIHMIHMLKRKVVAEGIESQSELDELIRLGCDIGQGYFIGKPMDEHSLHELMFPSRTARFMAK